MSKTSIRDLLKATAVATVLALGTASLAGCEDEGPFEQAGENIDEATDDAADSMEDATEEVGDAAEEVGEAVEEACEEATDENCG